MRWACGSVNRITDAPARLSAVPNRAMPTIVYVFGGMPVRTFAVSPTL